MNKGAAATIVNALVSTTVREYANGNTLGVLCPDLPLS